MNNAEIKQVLIKARELISKPENWTQRAVARTPEGHRTSALSTNAVCYCAMGALIKIYPLYQGSRHIGTLAKAMGTTDIAHYNDNHTHAEVLAMFDKAVTALN